MDKGGALNGAFDLSCVLGGKTLGQSEQIVTLGVYLQIGPEIL